MAGNAHNREDLLREAVALTDRVELRVEGFSELITTGFRSNSAMSVFVGQDPVYQFDPEGRLRRAFVDGFLYRSQHQTLARLQRVRTPEATRLLREDLNSDQLEDFRSTMLSTLSKISRALEQQRVKVTRAVPEDRDLLPQICNSLRAIEKVDGWLSAEIRKRP